MCSSRNTLDSDETREKKFSLHFLQLDEAREREGEGKCVRRIEMSHGDLCDFGSGDTD